MRTGASGRCSRRWSISRSLFALGRCLLLRGKVVTRQFRVGGHCCCGKPGLSSLLLSIKGRCRPRRLRTGPLRSTWTLSPPATHPAGWRQTPPAKPPSLAEPLRDPETLAASSDRRSDTRTPPRPFGTCRTARSWSISTTLDCQRRLWQFKMRFIP